MKNCLLVLVTSLTLVLRNSQVLVARFPCWGLTLDKTSRSTHWLVDVEPEFRRFVALPSGNLT